MVDELCFSEALLSGAKEVFETMIFMDLEKCDDSDKEVQGPGVLGSITFTGQIEGCLSIRCNVNSAKTIAANMLGMDSSEELSEAETADAIGEVTNMVMGGVKSRVSEAAGNLEVSIPSVVSGHDMRNKLVDGGNRVSVKVVIDDEHIAELILLYRESDSSA